MIPLPIPLEMVSLESTNPLEPYGPDNGTLVPTGVDPASTASLQPSPSLSVSR